MRSLGSSFSHLHVHTEFSMLDGAARVDELVARAVADGQPALGITDHGNMYGVIEFYKACSSAGIKPIIGTEAYMAHEHRSERPTRRGRVDDTGGESDGGKKLYYHLTLLAENDAGYRNLIALSSRAFLEGYYYQPRMDWDLLAQYHEGLIATSGCLGGHVLQSLLRDDQAGAERAAGRLQEIFGRDNFFVELQDHGLPDQHRTNPKLIELARRLGAPLLATNDTHYTRREDHAAHDALLCVQTGCTLADPGRFKFEGEEHYLKTADEMRWLFREVPEACDNTLWIAERADVRIEFGKPVLPHFPIPEGFADDREYLHHLTYEGARQRWGDSLGEEVRERLDYELRIIGEMGFNAYFLIVWDLIRYAHDNGIRVGPGRGSAAGCAVAYCLRITNLDPIRYGLIFERFLNPSRISMPDIDMDFDSRYRDQMIRYAAERYGRDRVAQIVTFNTIKARNAVRDAARVLGEAYALGDKIAKAMPPLVMGRDTPIAACLEEQPEYASGYQAAAGLRELYETDGSVRKVVDLARGLEGLKRSVGIHAAAVVITKEPLTEYLPIQRKPEQGQDPAEAPIVTQYEMHGVESLGLLKMDILGLRNLDMITDAENLIRAAGRPDFDIDEIPLDDAATFDLLSRGETVGVFQLESSSMRALLRSLRPERFEDVPAVLALNRPGPMSANMPRDFADFKNGRRPPSYFHPEFEGVLGDTYGLMIYQESLLRVAQRFAGYSLAEADNLRKACGKKDKALMAAQRASFVRGCEQTGYGSELGESLFEIIAQFADYGFAKSHAYGYGLVSYQTAYLKAHHPYEYFAALLTSFKANYDKAAVFLADARSFGVVVTPPDINRSGVDFEPYDAPEGRRIAFGLSAIRNVGEGLVRQAVEERRANGPYVSFHDFCDRAPEQVLNKRAIESLIKAGAFDSLGHPRRGLLSVFETIVDFALRSRRDRDQGVMSLFAEADSTAIGYSEKVEIPDLAFDRQEQLRVEKEMLGLYVSDHPLRGLEGALRRRVDHTIADALELDDGALVQVGGVVASVTRRTTRKGDWMATVVLEDEAGSTEVTVFPKTYTKYADKLSEDALVAVRGRIDKRDESSAGIVAVEVSSLGNLRADGGNSIHIHLSPRSLTGNGIENLKATLLEHPGSAPVFVHFGRDKALKLGPEFRVDIAAVMGPLRAAFGAAASVE